MKWRARNGKDPALRETADDLYRRLAMSLALSPKKLLFPAYFRATKTLGGRMPALIPQFYLH